jgi:hypothetical protein
MHKLKHAVIMIYEMFDNVIALIASHVLARAPEIEAMFGSGSENGFTPEIALFIDVRGKTTSSQIHRREGTKAQPPGHAIVRAAVMISQILYCADVSVPVKARKLPANAGS